MLQKTMRHKLFYRVMVTGIFLELFINCLCLLGINHLWRLRIMPDTILYPWVPKFSSIPLLFAFVYLAYQLRRISISENKVSIAPGGWLLKIARLLLRKKQLADVEETVADMRQEAYEALAEQRWFRAGWLPRCTVTRTFCRPAVFAAATRVPSSAGVVAGRRLIALMMSPR